MLRLMIIRFEAIHRFAVSVVFPSPASACETLTQVSLHKWKYNHFNTFGPYYGSSEHHLFKLFVLYDAWCLGNFGFSKARSGNKNAKS